MTNIPNLPREKPFVITADFQLTGDQPDAVAKLEAGLREGKKHQTLLGVTGSGAGVAHFAHLGGRAAGYALLVYWRGRARR